MEKADRAEEHRALWLR